jgi:hypothetical protein
VIERSISQSHKSLLYILDVISEKKDYTFDYQSFNCDKEAFFLHRAVGLGQRSPTYVGCRAETNDFDKFCFMGKFTSPYARI